LIVVLVITSLIGVNALFVAAEFSAVSARRTRITQLAQEGNRPARMLEPIIGDGRRIDDYVAACQVGITLSSLLLGFYGQLRLAGFLSPLLVDLGGLQELTALSISAAVILLGLTVLQMVLGELVPKSVGLRYPEQLALYTVVPMRWLAALLRPFTWFLNGAGRLILRLLRVEPADRLVRTPLPAEIELLVAESARGGLLDAEERVMLRNVFRLGDLTADQVMVPRPRMAAAPVEIGVEELLERVADSPHTRIPIYEEDIDHIIGFVHLKDLFRVFFGERGGGATVRELVRRVPFVPETMPVEELWGLLKAGRHYMAIVFDEYGGTAGMITQEDLIEEVFGELQDEFDQEGPLISRHETGDVILRGDLLVADVNEYLLLNLPTERALTIGGLATSVLGRPPEVGDVAQAGPHALEVSEVEEMAVTQIRLSLPDRAGPLFDGSHSETR
jgi:putative hemolysin